MSFDDTDMPFRVVVNHEDHHSIWPASRPIPGGWRDTGVTGSRQSCLDHIERAWTDQRPLSLRLFLDRGRTPA